MTEHGAAGFGFSGPLRGVLMLVNFLPEVFQPSPHTALTQPCRCKDWSILSDGAAAGAGTAPCLACGADGSSTLGPGHRN